MFDPIFNFNEGQLETIALTLGLLVFVISLTFTTIINAKRYIMSEKLTWFNVFCYFFTTDESDPFVRSLVDILIITGSLFGFPMFFVVTISLLNWCWLPLVIICGVLAGLKGARSLVTLTRILNEHKADKNAHK